MTHMHTNTHQPHSIGKMMDFIRNNTKNNNSNNNNNNNNDHNNKNNNNDNNNNNNNNNNDNNNNNSISHLSDGSVNQSSRNEEEIAMPTLPLLEEHKDIKVSSIVVNQQQQMIGEVHQQ